MRRIEVGSTADNPFASARGALGIGRILDSSIDRGIEVVRNPLGRVARHIEKAKRARSLWIRVHRCRLRMRVLCIRVRKLRLEGSGPRKLAKVSALGCVFPFC